jgi:sugar O-acyltransferase (sialic acid O-acetyltransferase NeuD family)
MPDIVLFGAGQIAEVAKFYIDTYSPDRIVGFTVDATHRHSDRFAGLPLVEWESLESHFPASQVKLLGPLSYRRMNEFRRDRHLEGKKRAYEFTSFIHPNSHVHTKDIGENCFILEQNVIQPFARVGAGVMMWSSNHIGHHAVIGDYCFFSSQAVICGSSTIGERCFVAANVTVEDGIIVGDGCFLGSAAIVKRNLPAESVVPGTPDTVAPFPASRMKRLI